MADWQFSGCVSFRLLLLDSRRDLLGGHVHIRNLEMGIGTHELDSDNVNEYFSQLVLILGEHGMMKSRWRFSVTNIGRWFAWVITADARNTY